MKQYQGLKIGKKYTKLPLIQGGMGIGISLGGLAGAVAAEGGAGVISAAQIGFREPDFDEEPFTANLRAIHREVEKARALSKEGVIGMNVMTAMNGYESYVREAVKAGVDFIVSGAGLPVDLPAYTEGSDTAIAPIVSTEKSASVILKYWDKKYKKIPDLLIVEGPKAGGHLGFTKEQLEFFTENKYKEEIGAILRLVKTYEEKYGEKIPVILAGGIDSREKAEEAFSIGADGIQVATRFVTTKECDAASEYKEAYVKAKKEDICIVKSPVGMPGRAIHNAFLEKVERREKKLCKCHKCLHRCNPGEIPYCITDALIQAAEGNVEDALIFCGANAWKISEIQTVSQVVRELFPDFPERFS